LTTCRSGLSPFDERAQKPPGIAVPWEFVVHVIQEFFSKDRETATQIMLKIHLEGKGICGIYTRDVASTKVDQVLAASRAAGHPLQCLSEPVE